MAQGKLTDFFSSRKRNPSLQPSKRRKVEITTSNVDIRSLEKTNLGALDKLTPEIHDPILPENAELGKKENVFSPLQTRAARKAKNADVSKKTRTRKAAVDSKQKLISESFSCSDIKTGAVTLTEDVTSSWDEHDGPAQTETPQKQDTEKADSRTRKRTRNVRTAQTEEPSQDGATPEKRQPPVTTDKTGSKAKKKLQLVSDPVLDDTSVEQDHQQSEPTVKASRLQTGVSAKVSKALAKCKALQSSTREDKRASVEDMKAKLGKVTNLDDLKQRLAQMKETREKIKTPKLHKFDKIEVKTESDVKPTVPAYERFHHLATPASPTLSLPYKYRLLTEQFRGMDQVVSMLHNRSEVCTFSKLKAAVQELTKRNFEKHHVSQIKTVYPEAYEYRQEKGIQNMQGFREPGYQLTVEARLSAEDNKKGKETFKASHLLSRRNVFHSGLISIVKKHHKEFLANLSRPLSIPDDKITRWHPKFPLDEVPDVVESPLPQPPDVQTLQTARDVLESTRGRVDPKIEAALKVAIKEEKDLSTPSPDPKPVTSSVKKMPVDTVMKGVPQSLLEKIRAKEAAKTAAALTRDPKAEKRLVMMKRLPDIMRIIKSQFVTDKKPALPMDSVIQRIWDSYKSCIALGDIEPHINLCIELLPEWISSVKIKQGQYLKIDRNIELQTLNDKINNIVKGKV